MMIMMYIVDKDEQTQQLLLHLEGMNWKLDTDRGKEMERDA